MKPILVRIRKIISEKGISDSQFARDTDYAQTTVANMFVRDSEPRSDLLEKIIEKYNVNPNWLLTGEGEMFKTGTSIVAEKKSGIEERIPILSQKVSCGPGQVWEHEDNIVEYLDVRALSPVLHSRNVYGFRAIGTSMLGAGIRDGDIVLFNADKDSPVTDGIYVFGLDGDTYCKRLEFDRLANRIKIFSVRVADLEKAELLKTLDSTDDGFNERFRLFGKVFSWIHVINGEIGG